MLRERFLLRQSFSMVSIKCTDCSIDCKWETRKNLFYIRIIWWLKLNIRKLCHFWNTQRFNRWPTEIHCGYSAGKGVSCFSLWLKLRVLFQLSRLSSLQTLGRALGVLTEKNMATNGVSPNPQAHGAQHLGFLSCQLPFHVELLQSVF